MKVSSCAALAAVLLLGSLASATPAEDQYRLNNFPANYYPPNGPLYPTGAPVNGSSYDYIVVGSGPGGSPLAARLALAGFSVLLVDAGEDHGTERQVQVPALHISASEYEPTRWDYFVDHYENNTQALRDTKMTYRTADGKYYVGMNPPPGSVKLGIWYPRAGSFGGCGVHNALITVLPSGEDWEGIRWITGDDSWKQENMRRYFTKLEQCGYRDRGTEGHGFDGWFKTQLTSLRLIAQDTRVLSMILSAAEVMGDVVLKTVDDVLATLHKDVNSADPDASKNEKLYQIPLAMSPTQYIRSTPRDFAYDVATALNPDGSRKYHLDIALGTLVTKINFDVTPSARRATSISYLFTPHLFRADPLSSTAGPGIPGTVSATREIIVSAGAFNTPQLLKLSGIGPAPELTRLGIPVVHDSPGVGSNLQDRYEVAVIGQASDDFLLLNGCTFLSTNPDPCYIKWANRDPQADKGAYATNTILFGYVHRSSVAEGTAPDIFIAGVPANFLGYFPGYAHHAAADHKHWTWVILKARNRNNAGTVNLTSTDARDMPRINFHNFQEGTGGPAGLESQKDLQAVYEAVQFAIQALEGARPIDNRPWGIGRVWPPGSMTEEGELKQWIMDEAWGHHACCTAKIGRDGDAMAVLDGKFKVRGVTGLRVVDASVFPKIPGLYIALPIYMVSEKAAEVIIADVRND